MTTTHNGANGDAKLVTPPTQQLEQVPKDKAVLTVLEKQQVALIKDLKPTFSNDEAVKFARKYKFDAEAIQSALSNMFEGPSLLELLSSSCAGQIGSLKASFPLHRREAGARAN
jgi:hypothetical protein